MCPVAGDSSQLTMGDKLHAGEPRNAPLPFVDNPNEAAEQEFVTQVRLAHEVRPGAHLIRDHDFRNPSFALFGEAPKAEGPEAKYEQYHYQPGAFLIETGKGGGTPVADDKGVARRDQKYGKALAERALLELRSDKRHVNFSTNALDLGAGSVFSISHHPHAEIAEGKN